MATIKQNIKENFRNSMEQNTGIVGQVLKDRREKQIHEKEVAAELSQINIKTTRLKNDGRAFKKIEISTIQISKNLQIINKWADAQVTTNEETHQALEQQQEVAQPQNLPKISIPDPKEDGSIFDNILDLFDKMGTKIKRRFPKGTSRAKKIFDVARRVVKSPITRVAGATAIGVGAATYSESLNKNEDKELAERRKQAPTITPPKEAPATPAPEAPAYGNEQRRVKQFAPTPAVVPEVLQKLAVPTPAPAPLSPPPAPTPPPTAAVPVPPAPPPEQPKVAKASTAASAPAAAPAPSPAAGAPSPSSSVPALSSVVKTATPTVSLDGIQATFEKAVASMAMKFKQETGKTLSVTSGVRTNEEQKQLYDAKVTQLGGNEAAAKKLVAEPMPPLGKGKGSMHLKGLAIDINSKGDSGINALAGSRDAPTGWLEKFGLTRPVPKEDWHIQLSGTPPAGDVGGVPGKDGNPIDPATGKHMAIPVDPNSGAKLLDSSKTVEQLKKDQNARGTQTVIMTETTNKTDYEKKKKPQGQTTAAVG